MFSLPYKIKADAENEIWQKYVARSIRLITENTAGMVNGKFITAEYEDIIDPKPIEIRSANDVINSIKDKINKMK